MLKDYHIHTKRCKHATGEMHKYVEKAIENKLSEIAFTDHIPLPDNFDIAHRMALAELDDYMNEIDILRAKYREIKILSGIEADYYEGFEEFLHKILQEYHFDVTIMSVHFIKGWPGNNWVFSYYFPDRPIRSVYSDYLSVLKKGVETGLFQIVGHLDLIKSESHPLHHTNPDEFENLLSAIKKSKMAVELNTSGIRKEINETYPTLDILPYLVKYEIPVTTGSDAHQPEQVGFYFNELKIQLDKFDSIGFAQF